ncbi:MAG: hypothetical protein J0L75_01435 [Spirochaetes bacterium]|nr:hypothetical protein [Spirochaetota bacterium]
MKIPPPARPDFLPAAAILVLLFSMLGACADRRPVALLSLEMESCSPADAGYIEKSLLEGLGSRRPVVAPFAVRQQLGEACAAAACNAETAKALGSSDVFSGRLSKKEGEWRLRLERYRAKDGANLARSWRETSVEALAQRARRGAVELIDAE